ncbi:MAG: UDP-N-acetylglucosamine diphosphorylase [Parachlamydiaceae bacterium]
MSLNLFVKNQNLFDLSSYQYVELFSDCQYLWDAIKNIKPYLKNYPLGRIDALVSPGAHLLHEESISIGKGTIVEPGAFIQGPCIIGDNCQIRKGAYIRGNVIIGNHCVVGSELKNVILMNGANAAHFNYVGDSILGNHVNLGAGAKCANLRLDRREIAIWHEGHQFSTGLKKFGAILGDFTQIGCNSVLLPGTVTGQRTFIYPCLSIGGIIPSGSLVKTSSSLKIQEIPNE